MKNPKVKLIKLAFCPTGYLAEYLFVTIAREKPTEYKNALRMLEYQERQLVDHKRDEQGNLVTGPDHKTIPVYQKVRKVEYHTDDFFTENQFSMSLINCQHRDLDEDEDLYEKYVEVMDKHRVHLAEVEASKILAKKQQELAKEKQAREVNRKERRAAKKTGKKIRANRRLKEVNQ